MDVKQHFSDLKYRSGFSGQSDWVWLFCCTAAVEIWASCRVHALLHTGGVPTSLIYHLFVLVVADGRPLRSSVRAQTHVPSRPPLPPPPHMAYPAMTKTIMIRIRHTNPLCLPSGKHKNIRLKICFIRWPICLEQFASVKHSQPLILPPLLTETALNWRTCLITKLYFLFFYSRALFPRPTRECVCVLL